jgi:thiosulfate/3-mercaptopyruvate sulfurtransferase
MLKIFAAFALVLLTATATPAQAAEPLVDAVWVDAHKADAGVVVLDIRNKIDGGSAEAYREGHVPGAVYSNYLDDGWRVAHEGVPGYLPPIDDMEKLIGGLGIGNDTHVVIVAGGVSSTDMGSATRIYWTFKVLGHDKVSILNGGHRAYAASYELEKGWNEPTPATFAGTLRPELLASADEVAAQGANLIDNRPAEQYKGESKHPAAKRAGTIPGAANVRQGELVAADGTFVAGEQVAALLKKAGVSGEGEQVTFCNTGHWASLGWFAISEIMGNKQTKLYDGSMVDWTSVESRPVATSAE